jgi:anti-sigma regulatory factor (Ser/Thr protein kinase)
MHLQYKIEAGEFVYAGHASSRLKKTLTQLGIKSSIIRRVCIAMYEGEINMVIHANGGMIDIDISPKVIKVVLEDQGPGIEDIDKAMEEGYSTASEEARNMGFGAGMGLSNMKKNCDNLKITSEVNKGTKVEITVFIRG